jgi:RNA polymerase sigma-70 factor (ECF subfamily)
MVASVLDQTLMPPEALQYPRRERARRVRAMTMDVEDGELMLRYARGDMLAFETLYRRHRTSLYRFLVRHTRDPEIANDLFQEVWSKVISSRERYEPRAKFRTFLYRIAYNCFIDSCRRSTARVDRVAADDTDWESFTPAPATDAPDAHAERAQTLARYRRALAELPQEQRDVFLLYEESGLSLDEIAAITNVGMETAKSRLRYAVAKLRHALASPTQSLAPGGTPLEEPGS